MYYSTAAECRLTGLVFWRGGGEDTQGYTPLCGEVQECTEVDVRSNLYTTLQNLVLYSRLLCFALQCCDVLCTLLLHFILQCCDVH